MLRSKSDVLLLPRDELELALSAEVVGREIDWADSVSSALTELEQALRQHVALAEMGDGIYSKVDLTRPTLVRQINHLRREHMELLGEVRALQDQVARASWSFQPQPAGCAAGGLPAVEMRGSVPDFGAIRARAERFLAQLAHHEEEEDLLIMESVGTDIGAGD